MAIRPTVQTKTVVTPDTGISVTLKTKQSYGDKVSIYNTVFGNLQINTGDPSNTNVTFSQAFEMALITLTRMIVSWDVTEEDGMTIEVNRENLQDILTEDDVNFLMTETRNTAVADEEGKKK